jgi:hypothetical protein
MLLCCVVDAIAIHPYNAYAMHAPYIMVEYFGHSTYVHSEPFDVYRLSIAFDLIKQEQMQIKFETRRAN